MVYLIGSYGRCELWGEPAITCIIHHYSAFQVPVRQWAAVDGFDLQDQVLEIVDSGVVEPAALPRLPSDVSACYHLV